MRKKATTLILMIVITFPMLLVFRPSVAAATTYEYLIVTTAQLSDEFQVLANWKAKWVNGAKVETVSPNATNIEIKNIINDYYVNHKTKYVLLGGDVGVIPCHTYVVRIKDIAEDYWFANLDGDEEISDYEVYIGRAPVDDDAEATAFVNKVISFERMTKPKANSFHQARFKNGNVPDSREIAWHCEQYVPPDYTNYELFEENGTIEKTDWINFWSQDSIMLVHVGHGTVVTEDGKIGEDSGEQPLFKQEYVINQEVGGTIKWTVDDIPSLNNTFWPIHTSVACNTGYFRADDCLAEAYVKSPDHGAIACFMNDRDGFYLFNDSTQFSGSFVEMQFKVLYEDGVQNIGGILAESKHYLINKTIYTDPSVRWAWEWCWREINLIGDPETPVLTKRNNPPLTPSPPYGPTTGYVYTTIEYSTTTTDPEDDDVLYEFSWGDNTSTIIGPYPSGENVNANHQWTRPSTYEIKVRTKDIYDEDWSDWSNSTLVTISQNDAGTGQDAGDSYDSATFITPNSYKGTLYYSTTPFDVNDYYQFYVQSGQTIAVSMTPPEGVNFDLELYSPSDPNNPVAGSYNGNGTTDSVTVYQAESGNWRARIFRKNKEGQCSFVVSVYTPSGGCPFVYPWNGTDFVIDNNLLPKSSRSNGTEVEDYYRLEQNMVPVYEGYNCSIYSLLIGEFQQEHSYFDQVQLFVVDHGTDVNVAVSPTGEILTYQNPYAPLSAVDEQGTSWVEELNEVDGNYYEGYNGSFLILNFGEVTTQDAKLVMSGQTAYKRVDPHSSFGFCWKLDGRSFYNSTDVLGN